MKMTSFCFNNKNAVFVFTFRLLFNWFILLLVRIYYFHSNYEQQTFRWQWMFDICIQYLLEGQKLQHALIKYPNEINRLIMYMLTCNFDSFFSTFLLFILMRLVLYKRQRIALRWVISSMLGQFWSGIDSTFFRFNVIDIKKS